MKAAWLQWRSWSILLMLAVGCTSGSGIDQARELTATTLPTETQTLVIPTSPTPTIEMTLEPEESPTVEATPLPKSVDFKDIKVCSGGGIPISPSPDYGIRGTIVFQMNNRIGLYAMGGKPLIYSSLSVAQDRHYRVFGFSPNGEWLAFSPESDIPDSERDIDETTLILYSARGEILEEILDLDTFNVDLEEYLELVGFDPTSHWINDSLFHVTMAAIEAGHDSPPQIVYRYPKVLDPFEGVWKEDLVSNLPNRLKSDPWSLVSFSPDMTRALYISWSEASYIKRMVLWDMQNNEKVWISSEIQISHHIDIEWAPNSMIAAYANIGGDPKRNEVTLITRDAAGSQTIYDSNFGPFVRSIRWSNNSRYLGIVGEDGNHAKLFVYDTVARQYILQCPMYGYFGWPQMIWSPTDDFIAFTDRVESPLQILDWKEGTVVEILQNGSSAYWSENFPTIWK